VYIYIYMIYFDKKYTYVFKKITAYNLSALYIFVNYILLD